MPFISSYKLFSFSRYLSFYHDVFVMQKKWLDQKDKINFKIREVTTWLTNNSDTHTKSNTRSKSNQTMKLGQLIECNNRKIFLKKYAENEEWRLVPDFFLVFKNA